MNETSKSFYLLVKLEHFNEDLQQEILEIALEYAIIPYSSKEENSFIFEASSEKILSQFCDKLNYEDFPITSKRILR